MFPKWKRRTSICALVMMAMMTFAMDDNTEDFRSVIDLTNDDISIINSNDSRNAKYSNVQSKHSKTHANNCDLCYGLIERDQNGKIAPCKHRFHKICFTIHTLKKISECPICDRLYSLLESSTGPLKPLPTISTKSITDSHMDMQSNFSLASIQGKNDKRK